jgi:hypothetical protein
MVEDEMKTVEFFDDGHIPMESYLRLGSAMIREVLRDIKLGPRGENRSRYLSAVSFLRSSLFEMICDVQGLDAALTKKHILQLSSTKNLPLVRSRNKWKPKRTFRWVEDSQRVVN